MKLARILLLIGGVTNAVFFLFHLWLGWQIHRWTGLPPGARTLMEMLNGGGALFILLLAVASLACATDTLTTWLGRCVLLATGALYGLRAVAEVGMAVRAQPAIVATCLAASALYFAIWILAQRSAAPDYAAVRPA
jgi:hypothetical protein